ncbi:seipin isoform X6 [Cherax quadricarinatus]|uniref:seipin isoform X6 n=1 Tax=Cherax quadricarinatus TaxID=27406 RepID=UPI002379C901|nr:seipin-like isoform X6 [Cherax quadricarinatus]
MVLFGTYIDSKRKAARKYIAEWQATVYSLVVFSATMVVMFWASVFLYTSFYFTYMPDESITWPMNFHYQSCQDRPGICSNPYAIISVTDPTRGSVLARGQKYRVVVDIEMPESPTNQRIGNEDDMFNVGMFLINMSMRTHSGQILRKSSRSTMLRYRSPLLHTLSTVTFSPLLLYGIQEEKQMVTVELFSQYEEDPVTPLSDVHVELESRFVELYGAQLRIHAIFSGLRYLMYHYPLVSAAMGIGICMVFLSAVVIFSWYQFSGPTLNARIGASQGTLPNGNALTISQENSKLANLADDNEIGSQGASELSAASPSETDGRQESRVVSIDEKYDLTGEAGSSHTSGVHIIDDDDKISGETDSMRGSVNDYEDSDIKTEETSTREVSSTDSDEDFVIRQRVQCEEYSH